MGIFLLPLAYSPYTYDQFVLPKLLLGRFLVAVLLVLYLARAAAARTLVVKRTPLDIPLLLFVASAALSTVFAENQNVAMFGTYTRYDGLLTLVTFAVLYWLSVQSLADRDDARALIRVLLASAYVVAVVAILQSVHNSIEYGTFAPAFGSLGNPNVLGAFLALAIAVTTGELMLVESATSRILLANVLAVTGLALALSLSRSSWLATAAAIALLAVARPRRLRVLAWLVPIVAVVLVGLAAGYAAAGKGQLESTLVARIRTGLDPAQIERSRAGIWGDSVRLIASRPVVGYGPDNVGLVFPRFQTGDWGFTYSPATGHIRQPIDKAHAELLQVAATQGVIGVAAYVFIQLAFLRALWRRRRSDLAVVAGAGWIAYQVVLQLNFTALAAAQPFWIFAAAAITFCDATRIVALEVRHSFSWLSPAIAFAAIVLVGGVATPYLADVRVRGAVDADFAGLPRDAQPLAADAQQLAPWESVYAVEVGNIAFEQGAWTSARNAYLRAVDLGTFNAGVYRNLALADRSLGLTDQAKQAARRAVELDPFDPANQALLAEFETNKP